MQINEKALESFVTLVSTMDEFELRDFLRGVGEAIQEDKLEIARLKAIIEELKI